MGIPAEKVLAGQYHELLRYIEEIVDDFGTILMIQREREMNTRQLGKDGPWLTEIGLGAWAIGGPWAFGWGQQNDQDSIDTIKASLASGINWIDTAAVYGLGHSERIVSRAVADCRDSVFIATKCGLEWDKRGRVRNNNRPENIRRECEDSLGRLNSEYIDLYQIHWPDRAVPVEDSWGEMLRLKEEGKVRYIGVSNFDVEGLEKCQAIHPVQSLQPPYSLVHRAKYPDVEEVILPWCKANSVGVVAYSPLQNGLLTGKFTPEKLAALPKDDWRRKNEFFQEPLFSAALALVQALGSLAEKYHKTVAALAAAWVLRNAAVTAAIVGARQVAQAEANAQGADWQIEDDDMEAIEAIYRETVLKALE